MAAFKKSPLDGYWEEGYHYYLYISGTKAVLRDYAKRIMFKTSVKYDKKSLASGEKTELTLGETVLSRAADGEPMTWIKGLYYENGDIVMDYYYTIMGDTTYVLKKVDRDPFSNFVIRDREVLPRIQGLWLEWNKNGLDDSESGLRIKKNVLRFGTKDHDFFKVNIHAVSYASDLQHVFLTPEDLTETEFPGMTQITVEDNMLTSRMIICDVSTPLSVFVRREDYDSIAVPEEALCDARNLMLTDEPEPPVCGGTDETFDTSAPKEISSTDMTFFSVTSALNREYTEEDTRRGRTAPLAFVSAFAAPAENGTFLFTETAESFGRSAQTKRSWALVKADVFSELVTLVNECDLARDNGFHSKTHGLPEDFGGSIDVRYSSGEKISTSNNQMPVLTLKTGKKIADVFADAMNGERIELPSVGELKMIIFDEKRKDGAFTHAELTLLEDSTAINSKKQRFDDAGVYESEKPVSAETVAGIKANIENTGILAWATLPEKEYGVEDKSLTFIFADGAQIKVDGNRALPYRIRDGFFNIELEMTAKH